MPKIDGFAVRNPLGSPRFFYVLRGPLKRGGWLIDQPHRRYSFGPFHLDADQHQLTAKGEAIALPPKCFDLLCLLVNSPGQLLEKDGLMRTLWPETFVEEANLSNLIALLRKALGDSPASAPYIRNVPTIGYRFVGPVSSLCAPANATQRGN